MMRRPALLALAVAGAILALVLCAELVASAIGPAVLPVETAKPAPRGPGVTAAPKPAGPKVDVTAALVARPLFSPTRKPDANAPQVAAPEGESDDLPRLAGILISGESKQAIFEAGGDEKPIMVSEGDDVKGWKVETIAAHSVTVDGPGGSQTLEPKFDPNADADAAAQQPPTPPPNPPAARPPNQVPNGPQANGLPFDPRGFHPPGRTNRPGMQRPGVLPQVPPNLRRGFSQTVPGGTH